MTGNRTGIARILILLLALALALGARLPAAAEDAALAGIIPGTWTITDEVEADGEDSRTADIGVIAFGEDGTLILAFNGEDGQDVYSCIGTWSFEVVPDDLDRLTLRYDSTDNPRYVGSEYSLEIVYTVYAESWVEDDTEHIYLLIEDFSGEAADVLSPFDERWGYNSAAVHRERGPNMRVVKCSNYVSLREKPDAASRRLAKVPLGAPVLTFPGTAEQNGFTLCVYQDEYGYILSEYLAPAE